MSGSTKLLERARRDLDAAQVLVDCGFGPQAVSRAYYAALHAAEAALWEVGETRSNHGGVISAFGRLIVQGEDDVDPAAGRLLARLLTQRTRADCSTADISTDDASSTVADAELVVDVVAKWLQGRP